MRNRLAARPGCSLGFWGEALQEEIRGPGPGDTAPPGKGVLSSHSCALSYRAETLYQAHLRLPPFPGLAELLTSLEAWLTGKRKAGHRVLSHFPAAQGALG